MVRIGLLSALSALSVLVPVLAQQKARPGIPPDDALTFQGITLYGVIDIGVQYDMHGANSSAHLTAGYTGIGGYVLAFVNNDVYANDRVLQVY